MLYADYENSVAAAEPIELYDIAMGTTHWPITPNAVAFVYGGQTYLSVTCERSNLSLTGDPQKDIIEIKLPRGHTLATGYKAGTIEQEITLTIYRGYTADTFKRVFFGYLTGFKIDSGVPIVTFRPVNGDLAFIGDRRRVMRICPHKLYSPAPDCGLDKDDFKITGVIDSVDGITIVSDDLLAAEAPPAAYSNLAQSAGCIYTASSEYENYTASKIFLPLGARRQDFWLSTSATDQWFQCQFAAQFTVKIIRIYPYARLLRGISLSAGFGTSPGTKGNIRYLKMQFSNNGTAWTNIDAIDWVGNGQLYTGGGGNDTEIGDISSEGECVSIVLDNDTPYYFVRFNILGNRGAGKIWCKRAEIAGESTGGSLLGYGGEIVVGNAHRMITGHDGNTITINRPFGSEVVATSAFTAYWGCAHTPLYCDEVFGNMPNYGGDINLPVENPYYGNLIY